MYERPHTGIHKHTYIHTQTYTHTHTHTHITDCLQRKEVVRRVRRKESVYIFSRHLLASLVVVFFRSRL